MKKISILAASLLSLGFVAPAQIAFVDSKYILNKLPDYQDSLAKLNLLSTQWQKEIDDRQAVLDKMYKDYEMEQAMLSEELKKKREDELFGKEKEVRDLQRKRFGFEGDLFKKRQELVKPLEDKVKAAIQATAAKSTFSIILDKSEGITVMYAKPELDISEAVVKELGMK